MALQNRAHGGLDRARVVRIGGVILRACNVDVLGNLRQQNVLLVRRLAITLECRLQRDARAGAVQVRLGLRGDCLDLEPGCLEIA